MVHQLYFRRLYSPLVANNYSLYDIAMVQNENKFLLSSQIVGIGKERIIIYVFYSDLVWRMKLMIIKCLN